MGKKIKVIYDKADLSQVLIVGDKLQFIAKENVAMPMALADYKKGDKERLDAVLRTKKDMAKGIDTENRILREELQRMGVDAESLLQAGVLIKETRFDATAVVQRQLAGDSIYHLY